MAICVELGHRLPARFTPTPRKTVSAEGLIFEQFSGEHNVTTQVEASTPSLRVVDLKQVVLIPVVHKHEFTPVIDLLVLRLARGF